MRRDLDRLVSDRFDLAVVGGGVLGAFLAWRAAAAGWKVALLEARDFGSGTTSGSGKVLHGGLRYLSSARLGLTLRAQRDQALIRRLAPRLVRPLPFLVPGDDWTRRLLLQAGSWAWRAVTRVGPGDDSLPPPRLVGASETATRFPGRGKEVSGGLLFHDYQLRSPERLTLSVVDEAVRHGAVAANYTEVVGLRSAGGEVEGVLARDTLTGREFEVVARRVVNATGSWTPLVIRDAGLEPPEVALAKGIHVILDRPEPETALALTVREGEGDGAGTARRRRIFVMPWEGRTLLGASYEPYGGRPEDCRPTRTDVQDLLNTVNGDWPELALRSGEVVFAYAGSYPVFGRGRAPSDRYGASLHPLVLDHGERGEMKGLLSVVATKFTTAPSLAERVLARLSAGLDGGAGTAKPALNPLPRARPAPLEGLDTVDAESLASVSLLRAMVTEAVEEEMSLRLADFVFRRTWLGHMGAPSEDALELVARAMAERLGWGERRVLKEKESVNSRYAEWA